MKFQNGNWLIHEQFNVQGAVQAHDFYEKDGVLTAYAAPRPIVTRANMLDTMLLTIQFHSPLPGVIGVKIIHHAGVRDVGPNFELSKSAESHAVIEETDEYAMLTSGNLSVRIAKRS